MCSPEQVECVRNIKVNATCAKSCRGLTITSFTKSEFDEDSLMDIKKTINAYKSYKKWFKFPQGIKGTFRSVTVTFLKTWAAIF